MGKLMQLFGESIDIMARAQELRQDPFAALDAEIGWDTLLGRRDEIAAVLATILAGAANPGFERMAYASSRVSHAQLTRAQT